MYSLRKKVQGLYPLLNKSNSVHAVKAKRGLDRALTATMGDESPQAVALLQRAYDYAATICANTAQG